MIPIVINSVGLVNGALTYFVTFATALTSFNTSFTFGPSATLRNVQGELQQQYQRWAANNIILNAQMNAGSMWDGANWTVK